MSAVPERAIAPDTPPSPWAELWRDFGRNRGALIGLGIVVALVLAALFAGAILTETIFAWPGVGKWLVEAIHRRDYAAVQGGILCTATIIIGVNLIVDVLYGVINPRIRHS